MGFWKFWTPALAIDVPMLLLIDALEEKPENDDDDDDTDLFIMVDNTRKGSIHIWSSRELAYNVTTLMSNAKLSVYF